MVELRVVKGFAGSLAGWDSQEFAPGVVYEFTESLAEVALSNGWAELPDAPEKKQRKGKRD